MRIKLQIATAEDVADIVALRSTTAARLTEQFEQGAWSGVSTEKAVLFDLRTSKVYVVRRRGKLVASLRLTTKKPWAIDTSYFTECKRSLYLLSVAVAPDRQRQGMGRLCVQKRSRSRDNGRRMYLDWTRMIHLPERARSIANAVLNMLGWPRTGAVCWSILK